MDALTLSTIVLGLFLSGIVKGATGLGYASCALPFLVLTVGLKNGMALVLAPAVATNITLVLTTGHLGEIAKDYSRLYASMLPGIVAGAYGLQFVDVSIATKVLGIVVLWYAAWTLWKPDFMLAPRLWKPLQMPTGFLNGVITGLTGSQVVPLVPYVLAMRLDPDRTVQIVNIGVLVATAFLALTLAVTGILTSQLAMGSVAAIVPAMLGVAIGVWLRQLISVSQFRFAVLITLFGIGFVMVLK
ncbi:MAG: sulfite exporter TauE/SafE family protein [Pseudomonadota bacterium]